ncbi:hypothetical protein EVAR_4164_1 [Eumeta japonica]|uniref:Uncharacterized protein n=1 Tax=Eumeta variegata TaxID=151549 RepID=A0A4C1TFZ6_EUMVA|nr:hypothetical protein EVAR_4164_1 [Eumeta japonica]
MESCRDATIRASPPLARYGHKRMRLSRNEDSPSILCQWPTDVVDVVKTSKTEGSREHAASPKYPTCSYSIDGYRWLMDGAHGPPFQRRCILIAAHGPVSGDNTCLA